MRLSNGYRRLRSAPWRWSLGAALTGALASIGAGIGAGAAGGAGAGTAIVLTAAFCALASETLRHRALARTLAAGNAELRELLDVDHLTGLMNRTAFHNALEDRRLLDHDMLVVLFFDLDRFKDVNDTLGHKAGDDLLCKVAERVGRTIRHPIAFARLGGDEFAAVLPWRHDVSPEDHAEAIVAAVGEPFDLGGTRVEVGASVGLAIGDPTRLDGTELLRRADLAMYAAKAASRGCYRVFDDAMDRREMRESSVRVELGRAMIENQFSLHYQPLVDARSGAFSSAEALLRSQSPALRDVSPFALIATAEASGQIIALTDWTIETALAAVARLENAPIAVNISPVYFRHPDFVSRIVDQLLAARVRPELLKVEITEGVLIDNLDTARHSIDRLREMGVRVFLDDFGTGYSSLSYLQHFELDGLKLDKSFLRSVGDRRKTNQIIRSMIDFGHSLDMRVVVEGVESDWQARLLQMLGCDLLQGYEIGMPMPLDDLIAWRAAHDSALWQSPHPALRGTGTAAA